MRTLTILLAALTLACGDTLAPADALVGTWQYEATIFGEAPPLPQDEDGSVGTYRGTVSITETDGSLGGGFTITWWDVDGERVGQGHGEIVEMEVAGSRVLMRFLGDFGDMHHEGTRSGNRIAGTWDNGDEQHPLSGDFTADRD